MLAIGMIFFSSCLAGFMQGRPDFRVALFLPIFILVVLGLHWQALNDSPGFTHPDFLFASAVDVVVCLLGIGLGLCLREKAAT